MRTSSARIGTAILLLLAAHSRAGAQVDPQLLEERWAKENHWADTLDKPIFIPRGNVEGTTGTLQVFHWDSHGRIKFDREERDPQVFMGYRALTVSIRSDLPLLDHTFTDIALAGAVRLGSIGDGWRLSMAAGAGTANDGRFDNGESYYPIATIEAAQTGDLTTRWRLGVSLDGNRILFPGVPLPYARLDATLAPGLEARLGTLESELRWTPLDELAVRLHWDYPTNGSARIDWRFAGEFLLFAEVSRRVDGFHLRRRDETRLYYEMNGVEAGLRWTASWIDVSLSAGYAFDQDFFTGFDMRDFDHVAALEDRPFVALTLQGTF